MPPRSGATDEGLEVGIVLDEVRQQARAHGIPLWESAMHCAQGNVLAITFEHASKRTDIRHLTLEGIAA